MDTSDFSRRKFLKTTTAGTTGSLILGWTQVERIANGEVAATPHELTRLSLAEASQLVRGRKISPVELTKACLAGIEQLNPKLNCFITVTADSALAQAQTAEEEIQHGKWRGPLHGMPIALKDLFDTAGVKTTAGSALFKDRVPSEDAEVVRRLKAAGAVLLGKTNMVEFAYGANSADSYFGAVRNPWSPSHGTGGSSSGSAAAVAAGLCYGALGSDTAGSIRQPASICGIVGLKPTFGLVSTRGVIPLSWSCDHVGPMTRTVEDSALMLQVIAGYDPADTNSVRTSIPTYQSILHGKTSGLRVGIPRDFFFSDLEPEVESTIKIALAVIQKIAGSIKDVVLPWPPDKLEAVRATVRAAEAFAYHQEWLNKMPDLYQPETLLRVRTGAGLTTVAYIQARRDMAQARRAIDQIFDTVDALVTPTIPGLPPTIAESTTDVTTSMRIYAPHIRNTSAFNTYGIPTISVPCGFTRNGLPIGLQLSGRSGGESVVLQLAFAYERATDWHIRSPLLSTASN
jgi:aspartyl-tRNA(Asn)/glutamyl-tRNA(Gln) amidotransferase subunit A